jgi:pimeloyl-ACP methyl ester carboxylesterase
MICGKNVKYGRLLAQSGIINPGQLNQSFPPASNYHSRYKNAGFSVIFLVVHVNLHTKMPEHMKKSLLLAGSLLVAATTLVGQTTGNPIAYWSFDNDPEGKILDASTNNLHGKGFSLSYETGVAGKAVVFNNSQARIFFPEPDQPAPQSIAGLQTGSISLWFKFKNLGAQVLPVLYFGERSTGSPHNSLIIEIGHGRGQDPTNRKLYFTIVNRGFCFDSWENLIENQWYHFVTVVSETGNTGYLNGKEMANRRYNLGSNSSYTDFFSGVPVDEMLSLGYGRYGQEDPFFTFRGSIDEVRIYDRALTAAEAEELFRMGNPNIAPLPDYSNLAYGPYERNVLDFWKAASDKPSPLVLFIHGGGFTSGDKSQAISGVNLSYLQRCLGNGVSFAAINYRFRQTTRLDTIMMDCARAVQFIRSKAAEWNVDKEKIAAYGGSAGGGASVWLAFHPDLADPENPDPILRESTRLKVAGHLNSQATYDCSRWAEIVGISENWATEMNWTEDLAFYRIPDRTWYDSASIIKLRKELDMISMIDAGDPPVYFQNMNANTVPQNSGAVIHHPKHPEYLKSKCDEAGIENAIVLAVTPPAGRVDMLDFFFKYLLDRPIPVHKTPVRRPGMRVYPNPANQTIRLEPSDEAAIIYDITGRQNLRVALDENESIDVSGLSEGFYLVKTTTDSARFIIAR